MDEQKDVPRPPLPPPRPEPQRQPPYEPPMYPRHMGTLAIVLIVVGSVLGGILLLVVIGAALYLPALGKAQEAARRASCMNDTRQIGLAMIQYAGDHDDVFPPLVDERGNKVPAVTEDGKLSDLPARTAFANLLKEGYLTTTKVFVCPSCKDRVTDDTFPTDYKEADLQDLVLPQRNCSYGWDPTKKHSADAVCAIIADKPSPDVSEANQGTPANNSDNHGGDGQNVFYNDGHLKWGTTSRPDAGDDPDVYTGSTKKDEEYWLSTWDAKIIR